MRIAIVHDWLVTYAGAERVLASLINIWPEADLFAVIDFLSDEDRAHLHGKVATTTFIQNLPNARKRYQRYLPLMPLAIEQLDLSGYDLIISSSHAVAKGVLSGPDQLHISYIHSPIRYAWDLQHQYLREAGLNTGIKGRLARLILHYIRLWDQRTSAACGRLHCQLGVYRRTYLQGVSTRIDGHLSTGRYARVHCQRHARRLLFHRLAHGALQAHADDCRSLRCHAGQTSDHDRRRA